MNEYPLPPLKTAYAGSQFEEAARNSAIILIRIPQRTPAKPIRNPDGIVRAGCAYCGYCERFGCMIGAKAQPTNTLASGARSPQELHNCGPDAGSDAWFIKTATPPAFSMWMQTAKKSFNRPTHVVLATFTSE